MKLTDREWNGPQPTTERGIRRRKSAMEGYKAG